MSAASASFFKRFLLPGFAFKAVVIGGGYATGHGLAEFFLPSGPWGGILGMLLSMACWSLVCAVTFWFARRTASYEYGAFFRALLGPAWFLFDVAYACLVLIMLSVFGAAAGAIGAALFGWPTIAGTLGLVASIVTVAAFGNESVESLFKFVTYFLYAVYALFVAVALAKTSHSIFANFAAPQPASDWALGGLSYAGYNVVGAVVILPVLRHLTSSRDALVAGVLAGPLAMIPAVLFYICMVAYYPDIRAATLPSDYVLAHLNVPVLHVVFQLMILAALLESATGAVHAINQRVDHVSRAVPPADPARPTDAVRRHPDLVDLHRHHRAGHPDRTRLSRPRVRVHRRLRRAAPGARRLVAAPSAGPRTRLIHSPLITEVFP